MKKIVDAVSGSVKPVLNWSAATGIIIALIAAFSYLSTSFASMADIEKETALRINQDLVLQRQLNQLANYIVNGQASLSHEIRDSKGFALTVRRDVLQSRTNLNDNEKAELTVILTKIAELNIEHAVKSQTRNIVPIFSITPEDYNDI